MEESSKPNYCGRDEPVPRIQCPCIPLHRPKRPRPNGLGVRPGQSRRWHSVAICAVLDRPKPGELVATLARILWSRKKSCTLVEPLAHCPTLTTPPAPDRRILEPIYLWAGCGRHSQPLNPPALAPIVAQPRRHPIKCGGTRSRAAVKRRTESVQRPRTDHAKTLK